MDNVPFTSPISPIGDQRNGPNRFARRLARRRADLAGQSDEHDDDLVPQDAAPETTATAQPLLEALDRLRVTQELRPADLEYAMVMRGLRAYQDPTTRILARDPQPPTG
jgi:hypothetical protein